MEKYFTRDDLRAIEEAKNFKDLSIVAFKVIKRMPPPVVQVCGPMTTGGKGTIEENFGVFRKSIRMLVERGENVFNQMLFQDSIQRMKAEDWYKDGNQILDEFYLPIFESGFIKTLYFIKGWDQSFGASWEHEQALRLGIKIVYFDDREIK